MNFGSLCCRCISKYTNIVVQRRGIVRRRPDAVGCLDTGNRDMQYLLSSAGTKMHTEVKTHSGQWGVCSEMGTRS